VTVTKLPRRLSLLIVLVPVLLAIVGMMLELRSLISFYNMQNELACADAKPLEAGNDRLRRNAIVNFYVGGLMDKTGYSHVSWRVRYHALLADFIIADLLSDASLQGLFAKTPCNFRRRRELSEAPSPASAELRAAGGLRREIFRDERVVSDDQAAAGQIARVSRMLPGYPLGAGLGGVLESSRSSPGRDKGWTAVASS
jgi:hypothetical protein